jgi:hypothetical protein
VSVYVGLPMRTIAHASIHIPDRDRNSGNSFVNPFGERIETKKEANRSLLPEDYLTADIILFLSLSSSVVRPTQRCPACVSGRFRLITS